MKSDPFDHEFNVHEGNKPTKQMQMEVTF